MKKLKITMILLCCIFQGFSQSDLPEWFFNPPKSSNNYFYTIGISDPGLNKKEALKQAEHRAMFVFAMFHSAGISYFSATEANQHQELSRTVVDKKIPALYFEIINRTFSNNNEAIVLLKTTFFILSGKSASDTIHLKAVIDSYVPDEKTPKMEYLCRTANKTKKWIINDSYNSEFKIIRGYEKLNIVSKFEYIKKTKSINKTVTITDDYHFNPHSNPDQNNFNSFYPHKIEYSTTLKRGIWYAFFTSLLNEVNIFTSEMSKSTTIEKEKEYRIVFSLRDIEFKNDSLSLNLSCTDPLDKEFYMFTDYPRK